MLKSKQYLGNKIICEYESSNLKGSNYDIETKELLLAFNNGTSYKYKDVPHEIFAEMNLSESQGKYFSKNIARNYEYKKIEVPPNQE